MPRGGKREGSGRPKGKPNRVTREVREVLAEIAKRNAPAVEQWLAAAAEADPARGMELYLRMIEYHLPKLREVNITGLPVSAILAELERRAASDGSDSGS